MSTQIALHHRSPVAWPPGRLLHSLRGPGIALLAVLSLGLLWSWLPAPDRAAEVAPGNQLVHWQDAGHDWLLVVDPATSELVVYDANDGRPLKRLGAGDGLAQVQSIVQQGTWLFVMGKQHPTVRLLKLPELREVAVDSR